MTADDVSRTQPGRLDKMRWVFGLLVREGGGL